jgi:hypothetical protein
MHQKEALEEKELACFSNVESDIALKSFDYFLSFALESTFAFSTLPDHVIWNCASFLTVGEIFVWSQLSKRMSLSMRNQVLWEILLARDFDLAGNPNIDEDKRPSVMYQFLFKQIKRSRKQRMERAIARKRRRKIQVYNPKERIHGIFSKIICFF